MRKFSLEHDQHVTMDGRPAMNAATPLRNMQIARVRVEFEKGQFDD